MDIVMGEWLKPSMYKHGRLAYIFAQNWNMVSRILMLICNNSDSK